MQTISRWLLIILLGTLIVACGGNEGTATLNTSEADTEGSVMFQLDAWADNWFAAYLGEQLLVEDSVSITTERSFNAETATFEASYPVNLNVILKDFKENDTGLEYIGSNRQQMGDGGMIFQIKDAQSGEILAVSIQDVRCLVVHRAPIDTSCTQETDPVEGQGACASEVHDVPTGWMATDFDDSAWLSATEHSERAVSPKGGYDRVQWDSNARLIWSGDLVQDNTLLCRLLLVD